MIRIFSKKLWNEAKGKFEPGLLAISDDKIESLTFGKPEGVAAKQKIMDFGSLYIGPSAIDLHVHARDFNESHKETFETCEKSALKGGVSRVVCMANTRPRLDSVAQILEFFKRTKKLRARFIPFAAATQNLEGIEPTDWNALLSMPIAGLSDDGKPILDEKILRAALLATKKKSKFVSLHEEDTRISKCSALHLSETSMRLGIEGSPSSAESSLVQRDLKIAADVKAHLHLGHISSAESVALIRKAKRRGQSVSAELTPHHGFFTVEDAESLPLSQLSQFKVCPPIRSDEDRDSLGKAVGDGTLDCFASDHAPHSRFEKNLPIDQAMHGLISLEYFFPLYNELRIQNAWSWKSFFAASFSRPAALLPHLKGIGKFSKGFEASFIMFDPDLEQVLRFRASKSSNTLFEGKQIRGCIFQHWISGKKVYDLAEKS
ncbi:MAG: Dihydroorotase [Bacteriovoracaceae bacterium]|nr:Dihydroorotase [Bacteriovoracaceae bacterium]